MSDEYDYVTRGKLKLKTDSNKVSKKKKRNDKKDREIIEREIEEQMRKAASSAQPQKLTMTKAEMAFKKMQAKIVSIYANTVKQKILSEPKNDNIFTFYSLIHKTARETNYGEGLDDPQTACRKIQRTFR